MGREFQYNGAIDIAKNLVFIDGLTRCGKSLFSSILPSLEKFEKLQFINILEQIVPGVYLGGIEIECAKAIMKLIFNENIYNIFISRNVNFKPTDQTGVELFRDPQIYHERLTMPDGDDVLERIKESQHYLPFQTHDLLVNMSIVEKLELDFKMLELFRHPVDVAYSWWKKGWGERFGLDPRAITLSIIYKNTSFPWYCRGYEEELLQANSMEKCTVIVLDLMKRSIEEFMKLENRERYHLVFFEDFVQNTDVEMERICAFFKTQKTKRTDEFIAKARCPRVLKQEDRVAKVKELKEALDDDIFAELMEFSKDYEKNRCGLM